MAKKSPVPAFDVTAFLAEAGVSRRVARYAKGATIFAQGGAANTVFYIQQGSVKLSVLSSGGKEAVVKPGDTCFIAPNETRRTS